MYTKGERSLTGQDANGAVNVFTDKEYIATFRHKADAQLDAAAPDMAESGQDLDRAIGTAIMNIAKFETLSTNLLQIIQTDILPAQVKWRKALSKARGE